LAGLPGELYYNVSSKSMGKRELLLIVLFGIAGMVVYHVSAPPSAPGEQGFSIGQLVEHLRRGVRGNRSSAETTTTSHHPVATGVDELKVNSRMGELTIVGEERTDIEAELRVRSNGFDDEEAHRLASETKLQVDSSGSRLVASVSYPQAGSQRSLRLTLKVPARLHVILEGSGGPMNISGVAGLELSSSRGEARVRNIAGKVTGTHHGGELFVASSQSVTLTTMGTDLEVEGITGETTLNLRSGELKARALAGPIEIDSHGADLTIEKLQKATGTLQITTVSGTLRLRGLRTEARIDARDAEVDIEADGPAPLAINSEGGGSIEITPADGGYQLDAIARNGDITLPEDTLETTVNGEEHRAAGPVHGGGPALTIRSARADITVRQR
jgi:hypothetical protein